LKQPPFLPLNQAGPEKTEHLSITAELVAEASQHRTLRYDAGGRTLQSDLGPA
jgi:hypothetical protein